jgi:hypothetical protein
MKRRMAAPTRASLDPAQGAAARGAEDRTVIDHGTKGPSMNHRHRKVLHAIFAHPVSANIDPKAVHAVFEGLGAEVTHNGSGRVAVKLNGHAHAFHDSKHSLSKDEVVAIRHFLTEAGIDPAAYPD